MFRNDTDDILKIGERNISNKKGGRGGVIGEDFYNFDNGMRKVTSGTKGNSTPKRFNRFLWKRPRSTR